MPCSSARTESKLVESRKHVLLLYRHTVVVVGGVKMTGGYLLPRKSERKWKGPNGVLGM